MYELLYCSMATREMKEADILSILEKAREKNSRLGITGLLVHQKRTNEFLQILEGEKEVVLSLLETIKADKRHKRLNLIHEKEVSERGFKDWNMAFANMESIDKTKLKGVSGFLEMGYTHELATENPSWAAQIMETFKDNLPPE